LVGNQAEFFHWLRSWLDLLGHLKTWFSLLGTYWLGREVKLFPFKILGVEEPFLIFSGTILVTFYPLFFLGKFEDYRENGPGI